MIANLLPTVDISGTVLLVYDILMASIGKETGFSIGHNVFLCANL